MRYLNLVCVRNSSCLKELIQESHMSSIKMYKIAIHYHCELFIENKEYDTSYTNIWFGGVS